MAEKIKLVEISEQPWSGRWQALIEFVKANAGIVLETETIAATRENIRESLKGLEKSGADFCRVSDELAATMLAALPRVTMQADFTGLSGFLVKENNQWWPQPLVDDAFTMTLSMAGNMGQVDLNSFALVAGAGPSGRAIISALAKMGFSTINVTDPNEALGSELVAEMRRKFFNVNFQAVPFQQLTTLPGVHAIVVNTTPLTLENNLLDELYFFNFLKSGGVVIDLTLVPAKTPLISEAEQWGARHLSGDYIAASRDCLMIELTTGKKLDVDAYRVQLRKNIDAVPFDAAPFLQRFRDRGT